MGMAAILFNGIEPFEQTVNTGWKLVQQFQRRRHLKVIQLYTPLVQIFISL